MKIAIQNSWPNLSVSAEREFIARFVLAATTHGWTVSEVVTSDEIYEFEPDAVIVTHEYTPKLTKFPTLGVIWSPVEFFGNDPVRVRNILSYDGYLVATESLRDYLKSILSEHGKLAPISDFNFFPTALRNSHVESSAQEISVFYAGVHWDGKRHDSLFHELDGKIPMAIYGDPRKWEFAGSNYRGTIPFDGRSITTEISRCGVALSLHAPAHRVEAIPSMRLFEAASAGVVIISDRIEFAKSEFGENLLYVDANADAATVAKQIVEHVDWVRTHPEEAAELARQTRDIFLERFTLEDQLGRIPAFLESVRRSMSHTDEPARGLVEIIVRVGSRPVSMVRRAILSIVAQSYPRIGLIIVSFRNLPGLDELISEFEARFERVRIVEVPDSGFRSTALWAGLQAAKGDFLCNLDDDDAVHPTHLASQVQCLVSSKPGTILVYSGVVEVQEEPGHWFDQINFNGNIEKVIEERRRLRFLEPFCRDRMLRFDNFIQSNAWMIKREALTEDILKDPETTVAEDVLFYLLLMGRGEFVPTWRATADWNWRSTSQDNSMFYTELWMNDMGRVVARLNEVGIHPVLPWHQKKEAESSFRGRSQDHQPWNENKETGSTKISLKRILRKPSLLLGPLAPYWRRFRTRMRKQRVGSEKSSK